MLFKSLKGTFFIAYVVFALVIFLYASLFILLG